MTAIPFMQTGQPEKIRVLIADDSLFIRTYLTALLRADPEIDVIGTASSGDEVVALAEDLKPDVVTMDYHMPGKNGVEAAAAIMLGSRPLPAIIMLSAFAGDEGEKVQSSLMASGAHVILKPSGEVSLDIEKVASSVIKKIKEVGRIAIVMRNVYGRAHRDIAPIAVRKTPGDVPSGVVVIGASTGGPPLIEYLLSLFDPERGLSVVVVQHMSAYFTDLFAERLNRVTGFQVREAKNGDILVSGCALVVPGGHMLSPYPRNIGVPAFNVEPVPNILKEVMIDMTMKTVADSFGGDVVGVLLSGMGHDGSEGLRAISENGGLSLVQDPHTATVSAMPNYALSQGGAKEMYAIEDIPARINKYFA